MLIALRGADFLRMEFPRLRRYLNQSTILPVLLFSVLGFLVMGYHPGAEDDAVYLSAVKAAVNPTLYPHDSSFFELQMRTSVFDQWMAHFVHATGVPVAAAEFAWQFVSLFFIIWACWLILRQLFEEQSARWGGLAMIAAMLTLPVAGTALFIADQYLHPRNPATALILFGVTRVLAGRRWQALPLLLLAVVLHPLMGALGFSFCIALTLTLSAPVRARVIKWRARLIPQSTEVATPVAAVVPFAWLFSRPTPEYLQAITSRHWFNVYRWTWYEWLGAIAPLVIFWMVARVARKQGHETLSRFSMAVFFYGAFQQAVAMILLGPRALITFTALEPMRYLQLVYVFMALILGAYLGQYLLKGSAWRWAAFLLLANGGMCVAQRQLFPATEHLELPGRAPANEWVQAFQWIRENTPVNAYFAVDPRYMSAPGEDFHSFRALAERSMLADAIKDTSVITKVPQLGPQWEQQTQAAAGWKHFGLADFEHLKAEFGVDWTLVPVNQAGGLDCHWHNNALAVCKIP
jgi:hypothetical protein